MVNDPTVGGVVEAKSVVDSDTRIYDDCACAVCDDLEPDRCAQRTATMDDRRCNTQLKEARARFILRNLAPGSITCPLIIYKRFRFGLHYTLV
jgi:hypothetical protein